MNNKGFTLIELLAVIVLLALIMSFAFPSINRFKTSTNTTKYQTMENVMLEYQKAYFDGTNKEYIKLSELCYMSDTDNNDNTYSYETGLSSLDSSCKGYVDVINKKAYLKCNDYETQNYDENIGDTCSLD